MKTRIGQSAKIAGTSALLAVLVWTAGDGTLAQEGDKARVAWLREHAVEVRSIAPLDEDFSDLAPLAAAIGGARVVQLGEASHGDGASFDAKARLVRFLHQQMGFDALAWESGFFDLSLVEQALRQALPVARPGGGPTGPLASPTPERRLQPLPAGGVDLAAALRRGLLHRRDAGFYPLGRRRHDHPRTTLKPGWRTAGNGKGHGRFRRPWPGFVRA